MMNRRTVAVGNFADRKLSNERSMAGQNAKISVGAGNLHFFR